MRFRILALVASVLAVLAISSARAAAHPRIKLPADYAAWSRVAVCEEGGWYAPGGNYVDALGIDDTNWYGAGGRPQYGRLSLAQRVYEIRIADRFIHKYGIGIPDSGGSCAAW